MTPKSPAHPAVSGPGHPEDLQTALARHPAVRAALARLAPAERAQARKAIGEAISARMPCDGRTAGAKIR